MQSKTLIQKLKRGYELYDLLFNLERGYYNSFADCTEFFKELDNVIEFQEFKIFKGTNDEMYFMSADVNIKVSMNSVNVIDNFNYTDEYTSLLMDLTFVNVGDGKYIPAIFIKSEGRIYIVSDGYSINNEVFNHNNMNAQDTSKLEILNKLFKEYWKYDYQYQ